MHNNNDFIESYLIRHSFQNKIYGVLKINNMGRIVDWFGVLDHFMGEFPNPYIDVYAYCHILEGILPLHTTPTILPRIEMSPGVIADIHLVKHFRFYWIFFFDATDEVEQMREMIQKYNEDQIKNRKNDLREDST
ncbi:MAG: hypothetical protein RIS47_1753 [Bacteroidota bacterium]|jgi:hypothetical protein